MPNKIRILALAGLGGVLLARRLRGRRDERDLWAEATEPPDLR